MKTLEDNPNNIGEELVRDEKGQFIKGHKDLGAGRHPGSRNFITDFDEAISEIAEEEGITLSEAKKTLIKKAYSLAKEGSFPFYKDIVDRYYGATQPEAPDKPPELHLHIHSEKMIKLKDEYEKKLREVLEIDDE